MGKYFKMVGEMRYYRGRTISQTYVVSEKDYYILYADSIYCNYIIKRDLIKKRACVSIIYPWKYYKSLVSLFPSALLFSEIL